ncbi:Holliday junction resolvase-like protein [Treponema sp.]|uniref:Holliday junction resolvase-like protein n=1 Tax=Treponema sp. TaxID=166 RepID=UPI00298E7670|nr:Holliday junction resolvase-like protein [Treponema sp.]MCR5613755.1 hypothetical protein [Treponema sp.]
MSELIKAFSSLSKTEGAWFIASIAFIVLIIFLIGKLVGNLQTKLSFQKQIRDERSDAVKRSRSVLGGQIAEQFAPFLPDFPARYDEVKFLGKPVDFIAFCGLDSSAGENEKAYVDEILFIEVKTGTSQLSEREKAIKNAVENGRVRYTVWRS